jgi:peptide/nickel transport system substrate-binding protein
MTANEHYPLGRPKIDAIEVRIITDPGTTMSNIMAGTVELTLGYGVSFESAMELRERWKDGTVRIAPDAWVMGFAQHIDPNPAAMKDVRFRRALYHALDRQEMAETLLAGQSQMAHVFLNPAEPDYKDIESSIVKYDYDTRRAVQLIEDVGYTRAQDGNFRDSSGQRPSIEIRTSEGLDIQVKATFAIADAWQRIGIATEPFIQPPGRRPREWSATFPGYRVQRSPNDFELMKRYRMAEVPTPENNYVGRNSPRYSSPTLDAAIERYFVTVPKAERNQALGEILHELTDQLVLMGMFYNVLAVVTGKRVQNVTPSNVMGSNQTWNAHLWDLSE